VSVQRVATLHWYEVGHPASFSRFSRLSSFSSAPHRTHPSNLRVRGGLRLCDFQINNGSWNAGQKFHTSSLNHHRQRCHCIRIPCVIFGYCPCQGWKSRMARVRWRDIHLHIYYSCYPRMFIRREGRTGSNSGMEGRCPPLTDNLTLKKRRLLD
jgi:hypothetical protein